MHATRQRTGVACHRWKGLRINDMQPIEASEALSFSGSEAGNLYSGSYFFLRAC
jgi:hypothetical protein